MSTYKLPYFVEIDLVNLEQDYDAVIENKGNKIVLDLNFDDESIDESRLIPITKFLNNLPAMISKAELCVKADFDEGGTTKEYIDYILEEFGEDEVRELLKMTNPNSSKEQQMYSKLLLHRIGFYPENDSYMVVFDFTIGKDILDYLVVVVMDNNNEIEEIVMES